jgi:hypothetical protein
MPFLSYIIAKVLALTDFVLEEWVDVALVNASTTCYGAYTIDANVNTCGQAFLVSLVDIIEGVVALVPSLLAGLFAR